MSPTFPSLPVWSNVKASYRLTWQHRSEYFRIARWWALLLFVDKLLKEIIVHVTGIDGALEELIAQHKMRQFFMFTMKVTFYSFPEQMISTLFCASIAVAWHQLILRGQKKTDKHYLSLDHNVRRYFFVAAILYCLEFIYYGLAAIDMGLQAILPHSMQDALPLIMSPIAIILMIYIALISIRMMVFLPIVALNLPITAKETWHRTRGNFWRLFWGGFLSSLPVSILIIAIDAVVGVIGGVIAIFLRLHKYDFTIVITAFATAFLVIAILPFTLTFLSLSYRHFFEASPPQ